MNAGIYENATSLEINLAVDAAHKCFIEFKNMPSIQKSAFLRSIAKRVEENRSLIIQTTDRETNLGNARLEGEFNRTLEQILAFAELAENESWKERIKEKVMSLDLPILNPKLSRKTYLLDRSLLLVPVTSLWQYQ